MAAAAAAGATGVFLAGLHFVCLSFLSFLFYQGSSSETLGENQPFRLPAFALDAELGAQTWLTLGVDQFS
jgi:hypothetical protein